MRYGILVFCVLLCVGVGFFAGQLSSTDSAWFNELEKPAFYPPAYLFGLVWTILYILMGISLYLVIEQTKDTLPYILFGAQLVLNFFWTLIFFELQDISFAIVEIIALWLLIIATMWSFYQYSKKATYLLIPYLLWVTFATWLTISIQLLN